MITKCPKDDFHERVMFSQTSYLDTNNSNCNFPVLSFTALCQNAISSNLWAGSEGEVSFSLIISPHQKFQWAPLFRLPCLYRLSYPRSCPHRRTLKEKMESFDLKSWVTRGTKIRPRIPSCWRIFEWNSLDIKSHINNLTLNISSPCIWLKKSPIITRNPRLNFSYANDSTF